jgi:hypothetical protein
MNLTDQLWLKDMTLIIKNVCVNGIVLGGRKDVAEIMTRSNGNWLAEWRVTVPLKGGYIERKTK